MLVPVQEGQVVQRRVRRIERVPIGGAVELDRPHDFRDRGGRGDPPGQLLQRFGIAAAEDLEIVFPRLAGVLLVDEPGDVEDDRDALDQCQVHDRHVGLLALHDAEGLVRSLGVPAHQQVGLPVQRVADGFQDGWVIVDQKDTNPVALSR